ncbi:hypothetical protein ACU686_26425 [Yinghuangia aomiensis]
MLSCTTSARLALVMTPCGISLRTVSSPSSRKIQASTAEESSTALAVPELLVKVRVS